MKETSSPSILIVDDDLRLRQLVRDTLIDGGFFPEVCGDGREAAQLLAERPVDLVITDLMMPYFDGIEILEKAKLANPDCLVILITGYGTVESAVEAIKKGAWDYIQKPFEPDVLLLIVQRAVEHLRLLQENRRLRQQVEDWQGEGLIGTSRNMGELKALVGRVAPFDTTILVQGETGTGKELVARLIHRWSTRREQCFLPVNCAALPESLLESELFGYVQGAFTGAERDRPGLFEAVDKGTLFLDEINSTTPGFQVKLLRVLQDGAFLKVGGREPHEVDVRVIAASNTPLEKEVKAGRFRSDLFYRLNVVTVDIPPLRERKEDIPLLSHHFLAKFGAKYGKNVHGIGADALARLRGYAWPGNVRELENVLERAVIMVDGTELRASHLQRLTPDNNRELLASELISLPEMEKNLIAKTLRVTGGHRGKTAEALEISPVSLWRKIKKYGLAEGE
jgi:DNA-binding NtrC family response regulator